jgi:large subunit ribosomal protein L19
MEKIFRSPSKKLITLVETSFQQKARWSSFTLNVGELIEIAYKIPEGEKERVQTYQGIILAKKNKKSRRSITIRRKVDGIGVEQIFFLSSPKILSIKKLEKSKVRRSKLYFLRKVSEKLIRQEDRQFGENSPEKT